MRVEPTNPNPISFGYHSPLKTLYKKGKMPNVIYGFYGDILTPKNVTLEHLKPHSLGGKSCLDNFVLATKQNNSNRGAEDIKKFAVKENIIRYLSQFIDLKFPNFNGNRYIEGVLKTLTELGVIQ